jgi:hypothetical protein
MGQFIAFNITLSLAFLLASNAALALLSPAEPFAAYGWKGDAINK